VCLALASLSSLVYCLMVRTRAQPRVVHLKNVSLWYALALVPNIWLGWKSFPDTNTQAYFDCINYGYKKFYNIWPWSQGFLRKEKNLIHMLLQKPFQGMCCNFMDQRHHINYQLKLSSGKSYFKTWRVKCNVMTSSFNWSEGLKPAQAQLI